MKQFLLRLGIFCLVVVLFDQLFYLVIQDLPNSQVDKRVEGVVTGTINADVLVLGSSRAAHNVLAETLVSTTYKKAFNLGFRGSNVSFHLFLMQTYLKHNRKPKAVIYVVDVPYLFDPEALVFRNDALLPYVKYPVFTTALVAQDQLSPLAYVSNFAKTNYKVLTDQPQVSIENFTTRLGSNPLPVLPYKGVGAHFVPNKKKLVSPTLIRDFKALQRLCAQQTIPFYCVVPPNNVSLDTVFVQKLKGYLLPSTIFYSYKGNYTTANNINFYDISHLNQKGATLFTKELVTLLPQ